MFQLETFLLWTDLCTVATGGGHVLKKLSFHWEGRMPEELFWSGLKPVPTSGYTVFLSQRCIFFIFFPETGG